MTAPWRDRDRLAALLAAWSDRATGRPLFRATAGDGWASVHLVGDDRPGLFLGALPGGVLVFPFRSPLPDPLRAALVPRRGDPLTDLCRDARLAGIGLLADDLVVELRLETPTGERRLRHQLFGSRGGLVLLDADDRMLYTAHPGPHPVLIDPDTRIAPAAAPDPDGLDAWTDLGLHRLARQREIALGDRLNRALQRRRDAATRLVDNLARDLDRADGGEQRRRDAETLAVHLHTVHRGQDSVTLADPLDGAPRTIALDPALPPHANLDRLFKQARKASRGRETVAERLETAREDLESISTAADELDTVLAMPEDDPLDRLAALQAFASEHADLVAERRASGRGTQAPDEPARPFRRYRIDDRWDVWLGRSNEENDTLTHRASHPRDLWLHAQGVSGSHVILRTGGRPDTVPRPVLEKAAALAALHSKARNSALVPVIWTERRYVRKPRKSAPGLAVCLQEKNLFVEPGVKPGVEPA